MRILFATGPTLLVCQKQIPIVWLYRLNVRRIIFEQNNATECQRRHINMSLLNDEHAGVDGTSTGINRRWPHEVWCTKWIRLCTKTSKSVLKHPSRPNGNLFAQILICCAMQHACAPFTLCALNLTFHLTKKGAVNTIDEYKMEIVIVF